MLLYFVEYDERKKNGAVGPYPQCFEAAKRLALRATNRGRMDHGVQSQRHLQVL